MSKNGVPRVAKRREERMSDVAASGRTPYDYGAPANAARRLRTSANAFLASSRRFLSRSVHRPIRCALDLGCGPGHTTNLLARELKPRQTVGLDISESFINLAGSKPNFGASFIRHDVTKVPFPTATPDLIYSRFLLGYLDDPGAILSRWSSQLLSGGLLLLEEVEEISITDEVIGRYFEALASMLKHQGHGYIGFASHGDRLVVQAFGPLLERFSGQLGARWRVSRISHVSRTAEAASRGFLVHVREVLRQDPFLRKTRGERALRCLEDDLATLSTSSRKKHEIQWQIRQVVLEMP